QVDRAIVRLPGAGERTPVLTDLTRQRRAPTATGVVQVDGQGRAPPTRPGLRAQDLAELRVPLLQYAMHVDRSPIASRNEDQARSTLHFRTDAQHAGAGTNENFAQSVGDPVPPDVVGFLQQVAQVLIVVLSTVLPVDFEAFARKRPAQES